MINHTDVSDWKPTPRWHPKAWFGYTFRRRVTFLAYNIEEDYAYWQYASPLALANAALRAAFAPVVVATRAKNEQIVASSATWTGR